MGEPRMQNIKGVISNIEDTGLYLAEKAQERLDNLTKPQGSLGRLEEIAKQIVCITRDIRPSLDRKVIFTMAADHGIADEGLSAYPKEVTAQMINNFLKGGAAINVLAAHVGAKVIVVDMGVSSDLGGAEGLVIEKIGYGTRNMAKMPAMTREQAIDSIEAGIYLFESEYETGTGKGVDSDRADKRTEENRAGGVETDIDRKGKGIDMNATGYRIDSEGHGSRLDSEKIGNYTDIDSAENRTYTGRTGNRIDIVGTGEMGIGNTAASSAISSCILNEPVENVTGRGTGIDEKTYNLKIDLIKRALEINKPDQKDPIDLLSKVGGFEIGGMAGVILAAASRKVPVVIDGFISGAAALIAYRLEPKARDYMIASHCSVEKGHRLILKYLGLNPLLDLKMRLGEGTGAALAMGIIDASVKILTQMATFQSAGVSEKVKK